MERLHRRGEWQNVFINTRLVLPRHTKRPFGVSRKIVCTPHAGTRLCGGLRWFEKNSSHVETRVLRYGSLQSAVRATLRKMRAHHVAPILRRTEWILWTCPEKDSAALSCQRTPLWFQKILLHVPLIRKYYSTCINIVCSNTFCGLVTRWAPSELFVSLGSICCLEVCCGKWALIMLYRYCVGGGRNRGV